MLLSSFDSATELRRRVAECRFQLLLFHASYLGAGLALLS